MSFLLPDEGMNEKTKEFWTTIGGKKIYAKSLEALCRTVGYGWIQEKEKIKCIYCGFENYDMSMPCLCNAGSKYKTQRRNALKKLQEIMALQDLSKRLDEEEKKTTISAND